MLVVCSLITGIIIQDFIVGYYYIPSSSMNNTLLPGDGIIVDKIFYNHKWNWLNSIKLWKRVSSSEKRNIIKRKDIIVFDFPKSPGSVLIKRCVALPGDSVSITNMSLYINSNLVEENYCSLFKYNLWSNNKTRTRILLDSLNTMVSVLSYDYQNNCFLIRIPKQILPILSRSIYTSKIRKIVEVLPDKKNTLYPFNHPEWTQDNYGPVHVPKKGERVSLNTKSIADYRSLINSEGNSILIKHKQIYLNNKAVDYYVFRKNYYFMMGDNRTESYDSRWWGLVSDDLIIGKATLIAFSKDVETEEVRYGRMFKSVE